MPPELGLFMGGKAFGVGRRRSKVTLVLERRRYSYHRYCSDIGGQDIDAHERRQGTAIAIVRNWLSTHSDKPMPGGRVIGARFRLFRRQLPAMCLQVGLDVRELTFSDTTAMIVKWLEAEQRALRSAAS
jgi:hypothetical protein